ncbi:hypothetical protein LTR35_007241 [Friedmanniomyces endolithicus]|uniref:Uncharacterized protein n=1 Tax=Friedmanniomyces endolithicus TaxID=329885 RepID=A0AAN6FAE8_9PEZI|nr:hypothetical protein LTS00_014953 [Friedmanniomyces endolithicus]KAK0281562.1 hypothetical protein LTR35_007241 [Friedmanniomyces endolithicus]KAK0308635.1 hypothetical protein LTR82_015447 [Friedmanniomyces endolithicus]KAK1008200.1 hypothetical protein LTR54_005991 [Friedmanniomyces endolithicus]
MAAEMEKIKALAANQRWFAMQLRSIGLSHELIGGKTDLDSLSALLKCGTEHAKMAETPALCRLIYDKEMPLDEACCKSALEELTRADVLTKDVARRGSSHHREAADGPRSGLRHAKITLPYRNIRIFLLDISRTLERHQLPLDDDDAAAVIQSALKHVDLCVGEPGPPTETPWSSIVDKGVARAEDFNDFVDSIENKMRQIEDSQEDHVVDVTLLDKGAIVGDQSDKDTAKGMVLHLSRSAARAMGEANAEVEARLRAKSVSSRAFAADLTKTEDATGTGK